VLFVLVRYMEWNCRLAIADKLRLEFLIAIFLIIASVSYLSTAKLSLTGSRNIILGGVLLLVMMELSVPFALNRELASSNVFNRGVKFAMLAFFTAALVRSPGKMRWFIAAYLASLFYLAQESFRGGLDGSMVWENQGIPRLHGSVPSVENPNSLGSAILGILPFIIFLFPVVRPKWLRVVFIAVVPMVLMIVMWSGSRTAYVGFIFLIMLWFLFTRRKLRFLLIISVLGLTLIRFVPEKFVGRFDSIAESGEEANLGSRGERMFLNKLAWETFLQHPTGIGVSSFSVISRNYLPYPMEVHCLYLEILTHIGMQGMIAFAFFVGSTILSLHRAKKEFGKQIQVLRTAIRHAPQNRKLLTSIKAHVQDLTFLIAVANATTVFLLNRLAVGIFSQDLLEIYWWFGAGIAISLVEMKQGTERLTQSLRNAVEMPGETGTANRSV
jgi:putative inorganic carbon (HCO3(-)) transporter